MKLDEALPGARACGAAYSGFDYLVRAAPYRLGVAAAIVQELAVRFPPAILCHKPLQVGES